MDDGVQVPSRAMNELYMLPFEMVVKNANPASVMCSFPDVNGTFACDSSELLQDALRKNWGFNGYVMSDRRAIHNMVSAIKAGMNVELDWAPQYYTQEKIKKALDSGQVTENDIDNLLRPRYIKMIEFGHMDKPFNKIMPEIVDSKANGTSARKMAEEGAVLLKNQNGFLPLDGKPKSIALIGVEWFAGKAKMSPRSIRDNNENVVTPYTVTPQKGLENVIKELGYNTKVTYNDGRDPQAAAKLASQSDIVLLMVGDTPDETIDRETLGFPAIPLDKNRTKDWVKQEPLIDAVLKANAKNTAVILKTSGTVLMPWLDQVPAVLEAWFPGMEDGNAVANLLYGKVNPSGKLPMTFGATAREAAFATEKQYPGTRQDTGKPGGPGPYGNGSKQLIAQYTEGLQMGYRWYEANNVKPVFPFGYGLSYTTFKYDALKVKRVRGNKGSLSGIDVSFTITNTGDVAGKEAAQVYLTLPAEAGQPTKRLVNFEKIDLKPGESKMVTLRISQADSNHPFSYFIPKEPDNLANWADGKWVTADGKYRVHVGGSSADTPLEKEIPLNFKLDKNNGKGKGKGNSK